ncbi:O-antigen ligase family protein, partial [Phenylobacterium sp.]|uniref:O-antigen ligase family protein n=1 Tax=Phenylobacterium sp. TaxID=1871053 RepID=UPI002811508B
LGAVRAYFAGVGAYEWRGLYVPFVHTWLPYLIVAEYIRSRSGADLRLSAFRIGLCVLALLLSLSRTGIGLILVFGLVTLLFNIRHWLLTGRGIALMVAAAGAAAFILPRLLQLDVVQQRIEVGIGSGDQSLGWRAMEQMAAINFLDAGGAWRWLFGYGLGAQMPLPIGVVDFAGNTSVPHLHNSYWTYLFKFGAVGTAWIMFSIGVLVLRAHRQRGGVPALLVGGTWILLLVMGTAITLQGMTEWSHLMFLGMACAMLSKAARAPRLVPGRPAERRAFGPLPGSPQPARK